MLRRVSRCHASAGCKRMLHLRSWRARAASDQGREKRVVVRVPSSIKGNAILGQDVRAWVAEGLVDTVVACPAGCPDFSASVSELREHDTRPPQPQSSCRLAAVALVGAEPHD